MHVRHLDFFTLLFFLLHEVLFRIQFNRPIDVHYVIVKQIKKNMLPIFATTNIDT